jgi:hypothetical protein
MDLKKGLWDMWTGLIWLGTGRMTGTSEQGNEYFGLYKVREIS